jgi:type IV secretory pathway VirB2 component (pilin)
VLNRSVSIDLMKYIRAIFTILNAGFIYTVILLVPIASYAEDEFLHADPWDRALAAVLQIMTGPTATTIGAIALAGTGYLFLRGRIDIMRLMAIIAGLALIFGAPHLASLLQHAGQ